MRFNVVKSWYKREKNDEKEKKNGSTVLFPLFICYLCKSVGVLLTFYCTTKASETFGMTKVPSKILLQRNL